MVCRGRNLQAIKALFLLILQKIVSFGLKKRPVETPNNVQEALTSKFCGRESKPCWLRTAGGFFFLPIAAKYYQYRLLKLRRQFSPKTLKH